MTLQAFIDSFSVKQTMWFYLPKFVVPKLGSTEKKEGAGWAGYLLDENLLIYCQDPPA